MMTKQQMEKREMQSTEEAVTNESASSVEAKESASAKNVNQNRRSGQITSKSAAKESSLAKSESGALKRSGSTSSVEFNGGARIGINQTDMYHRKSRQALKEERMGGKTGYNGERERMAMTGNNGEMERMAMTGNNGETEMVTLGYNDEIERRAAMGSRGCIATKEMQSSQMESTSMNHSTMESNMSQESCSEATSMMGDHSERSVETQMEMIEHWEAKSMEARSMEARSMEARSMEATSMEARSMEAKSMEAQSMAANSFESSCMESSECMESTTMMESKAVTLHKESNRACQSMDSQFLTDAQSLSMTGDHQYIDQIPNGISSLDESAMSVHESSQSRSEARMESDEFGRRSRKEEAAEEKRMRRKEMRENGETAYDQSMMSRERTLSWEHGGDSPMQRSREERRLESGLRRGIEGKGEDASNEEEDINGICWHHINYKTAEEEKHQPEFLKAKLKKTSFGPSDRRRKSSASDTSSR